MKKIALNTCLCGCGGIPTFEKKYNRRGYKKGEQHKFCQGHGKRVVSYEKYFWERVQKTSTCWLWIGRKHMGKYGLVVKVGNLAHRFSWVLHNKKKIPKGMFICHRCDNPACVNPDHLFLGTNLDNLKDMYLKGRNIQGARHPWAKLKEKDVLEIREKKLRGVHVFDLAKEYGITPSGIYGILQRRHWKRIGLTNQTCDLSTGTSPNKITFPGLVRPNSIPS